jgi:hypothetical protein
MPLNILTDTQVSEFVAGLDLAEGSEAYRTLNAMMILPAPAFAKAVSGLAQGLYDFAAMRSLPAMNEKLVDALIASRLGEDDATTLAWRYRSEWLPASIDVDLMRRTAVGDAAAAISARFIDKWGTVIRPAYDFLKVDETKYHSYAEAYVGYMVISNAEIPTRAVATFAEKHAEIKTRVPILFPADDADAPVLALVRSLLTDAVFLERQTGGRKANALLDWVLDASWRSVLPGNYSRFMNDVAYPAMVSSVDPDRTGLPGAVLAPSLCPWPVVGSSADPGWELDRARMARIHLPLAYGMDVSGQTEIAEAAVEYLEAARLAVSTFHAYVAREMAKTALPYRAVPGSPMGLLLCITSP